MHLHISCSLKKLSTKSQWSHSMLYLQMTCMSLCTVQGVVHVQNHCFDKQMESDVKKNRVEVWNVLSKAPPATCSVLPLFPSHSTCNQKLFMWICFPSSAGSQRLLFADSLCECHPTCQSGYSSLQCILSRCTNATLVFSQSRFSRSGVMPTNMYVYFSVKNDQSWLINWLFRSVYLFSL